MNGENQKKKKKKKKCKPLKLPVDSWQGTDPGGKMCPKVNLTGEMGRDGVRSQFMIEEIQAHKTPLFPNGKLEDSGAGG